MFLKHQTLQTTSIFHDNQMPEKLTKVQSTKFMLIVCGTCIIFRGWRKVLIVKLFLRFVWINMLLREEVYNLF